MTPIYVAINHKSLWLQFLLFTLQTHKLEECLKSASSLFHSFFFLFLNFIYLFIFMVHFLFTSFIDLYFFWVCPLLLFLSLRYSWRLGVVFSGPSLLQLTRNVHKNTAIWDELWCHILMSQAHHWIQLMLPTALSIPIPTTYVMMQHSVLTSGSGLRREIKAFKNILRLVQTLKNWPVIPSHLWCSCEGWNWISGCYHILVINLIIWKWPHI